MTEIFAQLGGPDGVRTAVAVLYRRLVADPELAPWFADVDLEKLQAHQRAFLSAAFGGPAVFSGRHLDDVHANLHITDEAFERMVATLVQALADLGVAEPALDAVIDRLESLRDQVVERV